MAASHLKRKVAPKTWPILRKTTKFITRPKPKGQSLAFTLPIVVVMRDVLGVVQTADQARKVLRSQTVTVNGTRVYDTDSTVGFMDIVNINGHNHRLTINENNTLQIVPVHKGEDFMIEKITGLTTIRGGKTQLNCSSGRNVLVEKGTYKPGDSVQVSLDGKLGTRYALEKGASVLVIAGSHIGTVGTVDAIEGQNITITAGKGAFQTRSSHAYVVGKEKPAITLN